MFTTGDHVPETPLFAVVAKLNAVPVQIGAMESKDGINIGFTTTVSVTDVAHTPDTGVKV